MAALEEAALAQQKKDIRRIRNIVPDTWKKIETWGRESGHLSQHLQSYCFTISGSVRKNMDLAPLEISNGIKILDIVTEHAADLLALPSPVSEGNRPALIKLEASLEVISQAVLWDKKNKKLKPISYTFLADLASGKKQLNDQNKRIASMNLDILQKCGFQFKKEVKNDTSENTPDTPLL